MACDCITEINGMLEEHILDTSIAFSLGTLTARTYTDLIRKDNGKKETRSKKPRLFAHSFCPFCGVDQRPKTEAADA